jgi:hypothetical protein
VKWDDNPALFFAVNAVTAFATQKTKARLQE